MFRQPENQESSSPEDGTTSDPSARANEKRIEEEAAGRATQAVRDYDQSRVKTSNKK
jgi:hypothetical protein